MLLYNLDAILAVGDRVRSPRGTQFRRWARTVLRDDLVKGFARNDVKLRGADADAYFDELLGRIRDIRASEKRFRQKVRDLFAATGVAYDRRSEDAKAFFAAIQNKLAYAATGQTAAGLVVARADPERPTMALTSWGGTRVRKADVMVAKNDLNDDEMDVLNRPTTGFLDAAGLRARRREQTRMTDWVEYTDRFATFSLRRRDCEAEDTRAEDATELEARTAATEASRP